MANSNVQQTYVSFVEEVTPGTTPGTPAMLNFRTTDPLGINFSKTLMESQEVFSHRQEENVRHGMRSIGGSLPSELSFKSHSAWLEALLSNDFVVVTDTGTLKPGNTPKTFSIEQKIAADKFLLGVGVTPTQLTISISPSSIVTANWELIGMNFSSAATTLGVPTDVTANEPFDGLGSAAITEGGSAIATVTSLELTINANKSVGGLIGSAGGDTPTDQKLQISGNLVARFNSLDLFQKFENETDSALICVLTNPGTTDTLEFKLPKLKYTGGQPQNNDGVVDGAFGFRALYDGVTENAAIVITEIDPA